MRLRRHLALVLGLLVAPLTAWLMLSRVVTGTERPLKHVVEPHETPRRGIPADQIRSGSEFLSPATRAQQDDLAVNPGMLWVEHGQKLWEQRDNDAARSCADCHGGAEAMQGVAARYPVRDHQRRRLYNLEGRIQRCRAEHQRGLPLAYDSRDLLALTALLAHQSRGMPMAVEAQEHVVQRHLARGRAHYYRRQGQLNLSCAHCHEDNWGKRLLAETVSQGHPNGYPIYRLEWQGLGSLHRRLRSCLMGVRAEPYDAGSRALLDLELFLAWRARGLPIETPAVRR